MAAFVTYFTLVGLTVDKLFIPTCICHCAVQLSTGSLYFIRQVASAVLRLYSFAASLAAQTLAFIAYGLSSLNLI